MIAEKVALRLVELACLAPSVHNTQPWVWELSDDEVRLFVDRSRMLPYEDPWGRNTFISCGAALDHLRVSARALGLETRIERTAGADHDLIAVVAITAGEPSPTAAEDIELLRTRCTDRRRFTSWPVPPSTLELLAATARERGAEAHPVTDLGTRIRLELLTRRAHLLRAVDPAATDEQRRWVGGHGDDGVPLAVLPAAPGPAALRFETGLVPESRTLGDSSDGVVVLGGERDDPAGWLRTGEALSSLWLLATRDGLSVVPMSLPVEIDEVREELRSAVLGEQVEPHLLLRVGWQAIGRSDLPRTPRRPVAEVVRHRHAGS